MLEDEDKELQARLRAIKTAEVDSPGCLKELQARLQAIKTA